MNRFKFWLVAVFVILLTPATFARAVRIWSYQELWDQADLVAIAAPAASHDTQENIDLPGFDGRRVTGVETRFTVSGVLKGDRALKNFVLHYYRTDSDTMMIVNGPSFVSFAVAKNPALPPRTYILFLHREADGRFASVVGQEDPGMGIREFEGVYRSPVAETQTKLGIDIKNVLQECQTIKPGMTRAELSKVFNTEGGFFTAKHRTFSFHDCPYIKVDVDFMLSDPKQNALAERPTDTIVKISKPYLDWSIID